MLIYSTREGREKIRQSVLEYLGDKEVFVFDAKGENYMVSNLGRVKHAVYDRLLKPALNDKGYYHVKLYEPSRIETISVHRLVARSFLNIEEFEVNHINGNKEDNRLVNLELVTRRENLLHAKENGLYVSRKLEESPSFRFSKSMVDDMIEFQNMGFKLKEIAEAFGTSMSYACTMIKQRKDGLR